MTAQHPIPSGLGAQTTAREAIGDLRLDGKTAIVTGGYAGIGVETARRLESAKRLWTWSERAASSTTHALASSGPAH